jgi:hypothetical protein
MCNFSFGALAVSIVLAHIELVTFRVSEEGGYGLIYRSVKVRVKCKTWCYPMEGAMA